MYSRGVLAPPAGHNTELVTAGKACKARQQKFDKGYGEITCKGSTEKQPYN
jgi:hypothetical protein